MRAHWLNGVSVFAVLAIAAALSAPIPATAEPSAAQIEAAVPVPEPANVSPPSLADVTSTGSVAPGQAPADPAAPSETPAQAATEPAESTPQPASAPVQPASASAPATVDGVPIPEPADVRPPTAADVGPLQLAPSDQAVADQLRETLAKRFDRFVEGKKEQAALKEFYTARNYAPMWIELGKPTERMRAAIARLKLADADGLEAADYAVPDLGALTDPESVAQAELKLINSLLTYARHAQSGRVTASRISTNIEVTQPVPEPAAILKTLAGAKQPRDVTAALEGFNPPHEGFKALRAKLAELRGQGEDRVVHIPNGPTLKKGRKDKRVPLLRQRLKIDGDPDDTTYDEALVEAVKAFQKSKKIKATGTLTSATVAALNGRSRTRDVDAVISNMERWRWLPRNLGAAYVMVNIPDFTLKVVKNGKQIFHTRIVVGKANTPSPVFSDEIENIQVNPTWHVPQSIIYGEYLPALQQDPTVLARMGLVLTRNRDGSISVRQPPGERNALGRIKFNFPNRFQVYLHDTPQKYLFAHDRRAYSHGCMRVQNPDKFGEVLASIALPNEGYSAHRFTRMYGSGEQWIKFKKFIPIHLVYLNAYVDEHGELVVRDDVYGYDHRVQSALNGKYIQVSERSQRVTAGRHAGRRAPPQRRVVQEQPFGFFWLFRDRAGL